MICPLYTLFWASLVAQLIKNLPVVKETVVQFLGGKIPWRRDRLPTPIFLGFLVAQTVKNLPAMWEAWVQSLGWEDPLEKAMVIHSSILAWRIPMDRGAWLATVHGIAKTQTWLSDYAQHSTAQHIRHFVRSMTLFFHIVNMSEVVMSLTMNTRDHPCAFCWPVSPQDVIVIAWHLLARRHWIKFEEWMWLRP